MAILIEHSTTPVYANAMNVDTDADGVVDGFTKTVDTGITVTYSLNDSAQKIEITASSNSGNAYCNTSTTLTVSPNTAYSVQVLTKGTINSGTPKIALYIAWYDAADAFISTSGASDIDITTYWQVIRKENLVSPSNAAKARVYLRFRAITAGDTGAVWFRNVKLVQSTICDTFATTTRAADSAYIDIAPLTGEWALSGAFALPYDSTAASSSSTLSIVNVYKDSNNHYYLGYDFVSDKFLIRKYLSGSFIDLSTAGVTFNRYQIHKFIISQGNSGMHMFIRKNNSATIEAHNTDAALISPSRFYLGYYAPGGNIHALIESVILYRNKAITTLAEADAIFDNMNAEMVTNGDFSNGSTGWTLTNGAVVENGRLKLTVVSSVLGAAGQCIKVLPNNTYKCKATLYGYVNTSNLPKLRVTQRDMLNIYDISNTDLVPTQDVQTVEAVITTSVNTYQLFLWPFGVGSGTFYWDDISVKLVN